MLEKQNAECVGNYIVTPLTKSTNAGVAASVSIRRGMYDRIFRFVPHFACDAQAVQYALAQGRSMVLQGQLGRLPISSPWLALCGRPFTSKERHL